MQKVATAVLLTLAEQTGPSPRNIIYLAVGMNMEAATTIENALVKAGLVSVTACTIRITQAGRQLVQRQLMLTEKAKQAFDASGKTGFSISKFGTTPKTGFMVSIEGKESIVVFDGDNTSEISDYIRENAYRIEDTDYIGGWVNVGNLYLDVSRNFTDRNEAIKFAAANSQLAYYDIDASESIDV